MNALVGEDRTIVSPVSGTTRDAIDIEFIGPDGQVWLDYSYTFYSIIPHIAGSYYTKCSTQIYCVISMKLKNHKKHFRSGAFHNSIHLLFKWSFYKNFLYVEFCLGIRREFLVKSMIIKSLMVNLYLETKPSCLA